MLRYADEKAHAEAHEFEPDADQVEEFKGIAARRVRLGLLLSEIGRNNSIQIAQEDLNRAMMEEARKYPGQEQQVLEYFKNNPQALEQISAPVFEDKIIDFVLEMAKVTDKPATMEELVAALQADNEAQQDATSKPAKKKAAPKKKAAAKKDDGDEAAPKKKPAAKKKPAKKDAE